MKGAGPAIHLSAKPLILAACRREQGNMPVLRLQVEELAVDINARDIKSNWPHPSDSTIPTEGAFTYRGLRPCLVARSRGSGLPRRPRVRTWSCEAI